MLNSNMPEPPEPAPRIVDALPTPAPPPQPPQDQPGPTPDAIVPQTPAPQAPGVPVPATYSGRVYLMFPASMSQDALGSVWETLEEAAGDGVIAEMRLVSQEAGVQFTLELGAKVLEVEELRKRMPGSQMAALEPDRLQINWSG